MMKENRDNRTAASISIEEYLQKLKRENGSGTGSKVIEIEKEEQKIGA